MRPIAHLAVLAVAGSILASSATASALPAFARKYGTSCLTCHTVFPKLTPFGEAFRRNGFRFPGVDSDYVKQPNVALGQEEYKKTFPDSVWPGQLPISAPVAIGFDGAAVMHPNPTTDGGKADNGTQFSLGNLVGEGHIWMGGAYDDTITYYGQFTFSGGGSEIEEGEIKFNDLLGPKHAVNVTVGRFEPQLSSFANHSSFASNVQIPIIPVTQLLGASNSFSVNAENNGAEVAGVLGGRFDYAVGINDGSQGVVRPSEDCYAQVGYKFGGMTLDGEGSTGPADPTKPWAETAFTIDAFAYHSNSEFVNAGPVPGPQNDVTTAAGASFRLDVDSLEVFGGAWDEEHNHPDFTGNKATMLTEYGEISYVVFPWLVPSFRVENNDLKVSGSTDLVDTRLLPAVSFLIRPNLEVIIGGLIENARGVPAGGWGAVGGFAAPAGTKSTTELEAITAYLGTAF